MAKKRGQNEGSIRKRKDGKWEARVTIGIDPDGKQRRKSLYGKTRQEVAIKMADLLNELHNGTLVDPTNITVAGWLDEWMREYKKLHLKQTTYINYVGHINNQINPILAKYKLIDLRIDTIQKFVNELVKRDLSIGTVQGALKVFKGAIRQAFILGMIPKNVTTGVIVPKYEKEPRKAFTPEQRDSFIDIAKDTVHGEVFILKLFTGMRIGELLALRWADVDFEKTYLHVNSTLNLTTDPDDPESKWHLSFGTPKTRSSIRTIPLISSAIKLLQRIRGKQAEIRLRLGAGYEDNDLVFSTGLGKPLNPRNMQRTFQRICRKADLQGFTPHSLRHTFATLGYAQGIDLKVLQEILGHANINETANTYTHVGIDTIRQEMKKVEISANF